MSEDERPARRVDILLAEDNPDDVKLALHAFRRNNLANAVHVVLLLMGGIVVPIDDMPGVLQVVARALPIGALSDITHAALEGGSTPAGGWLVLAAWAVAAPALAAWRFRWE